jgi:hypothetical protein
MVQVVASLAFDVPLANGRGFGSLALIKGSRHVTVFITPSANAAVLLAEDASRFAVAGDSSGSPSRPAPKSLTKGAQVWREAFAR